LPQSSSQIIAWMIASSEQPEDLMPVTAVQFASTREVAEALGVSEQTVRTWCRVGVIPAVRPEGTRKWRILKDEFDSWLEAGAGHRLTSFLDPAHRSLASDLELMADATEVIGSGAPEPKPARRRRGPALPKSA